MIIDLLKANTIIALKIGARIHYQTVPQKSVYPHVFFTRQNENGDKLLDGSDDIIEDSYIFEIVDNEFDDDLITTIKTALDFDGFDYGNLTVFISDISSVSDDYLFRSADSDALFMHGLVLTIHVCEND